MTESEWLNGTELTPMLQQLGDECSNRKLRLFACSCFRTIGHRLEDDSVRSSVELAENLVDHPDVAAAGSLFFAAWNVVARILRQSLNDGLYSCLRETISPSLTMTVMRYLAQLTGRESDQRGDEASRLRLTMLRDIFGNPFRHAKIDPAWLTWNGGTVPNIARAVYQERDFDRLPILADALEDAGCDDADILAHCRSGGPHVRGCWVVDLLLGKS